MFRRTERRSSRGQALVETGVSVLLLIILTFSVFDFGRFFWSLLAIQNGVTQGIRFAVTNQQFAGMNREESIRRAIRDATPGFTIADGDITFFNVSNNAPGSGGPLDVVRITVQHQFTFLTPVVGEVFGPNGTFTFAASSTMRNEPLP
jgi:Flp pilus assembly protein TadG